MQDKHVKLENVPSLGTDAELIIWSPITQQDGIENYSITIEDWQLEVIQKVLGIYYDKKTHSLIALTEEDVKKRFKKLFSISKIEN